MTDTLPLAQGFPPVDRDEWRRLAAAALSRSRGTVDPDEVEQVLAAATEDGFAVLPLYTAADAPADPPAAPGSGNRVRGSSAASGAGWAIQQRHWLGGGPQEGSDAITADLGNGVASLWLTVLDPDALSAALEKIDLAEVPVVLEAFSEAPAAAAQLLAALPAAGAAPGTSLGFDPVGLAAATGTAPEFAPALDLAGQAARGSAALFTIDSAVYHDAGASAAQEIALATAAGLAALQALVGAGAGIDDAAAAVQFRWVVSDDQFASIAKLRAARVLWSRILSAAGAADAGQHQHAATSAAMLAARDPWTNLIRNCVAAFAGGVAGAEAVAVQPHTLALGQSDEFSRRMARNTQHLLLAESHVGFVADPAGGSFYVEQLTRQLAEAAWSVLQGIEDSGGIAAALQSGEVADMVGATWQQRSDRIARRAVPLTGVSEFPDRERRSEPVHPWTRPGGGLPQHRLPEAFESMRDRADAAGSPTVTLVALGRLARYGAREAFAANLFAAGGIGADTVAFSGGELPPVAPVVCIVGADPDYADLAADAARAAKKAGAATVWLAGRAGERADSDAAAGIDDYVYAGCDAVAVLEQTLTDLGVPA